jgi:hypothetical protein
MYELKQIGKVFTSKSVGSVPSSYEKRIYRAAVLQRLRNTDLYRPYGIPRGVTLTLHHPYSAVIKIE